MSPVDRFPYPPDDPDTIQRSADHIDRWAHSIRHTGSELLRTRSRLATAWSGPAAEAATGSLTATARWSDDTAGVAGRGSASVAVYAQVLRDARRQIDTLRADFSAATDDAQALNRQALTGGIQPSAFIARASTIMARQSSAHMQYRAVMAQVAAQVAVSTAALPSTATTISTTAVREDPNDRILYEYQVESDGATVPLTLTGFNAWLVENFGGDLSQVKVTPHELEMIRALSPYRLYMFNQLKEDAFAEADKRYPSSSQNDNHNDAFRHAYWNALMASHFGEGWAAEYGTSHEALQGNQGQREAMDLYNNEVGRSLAGVSSSPYRSVDVSLADRVAEAVENGDLLVIDARGDLRWSNEVLQGETADPELVSGLPEIDGHSRSEVSGFPNNQGAQS
ncbi:hypothetical protein [Cellulomonas sp. NPDC089187]|uniref:DUF6973 domain-containing protein n=1 Tax=Cellulomonas sp. NPDC089187 TaxID=3154970 RepID=UPI003442538C